VSVDPPVLAEIRRQIEVSISVKRAVLDDNLLLSQLNKLTELCIRTLRGGGKVVFAGNGGSFADAQHLSAEFTSRFLFDRAPLPSLALGTNSSAITAVGNDYGYEQVFARELTAVAGPGDLFIPLSTSGNSANILSAARVARQRNVPTMAFTGASGGKLSGICECLRVPSQETPRIQECHILLGHILCGLVERALFAEPGDGR